MAEQRRLPRTVVRLYASIHGAPATFLKEYAKARAEHQSSFTWGGQTFDTESGPNIRFDGLKKAHVPEVFTATLQLVTITFEVTETSLPLPPAGWYLGTRHGYCREVSVRVSPSETIKVRANGSNLLILAKFYREVMRGDYVRPDVGPDKNNRLG